MTGALLFRGAVVLPSEVLEDGAVLCVDGKIEAVGHGDKVRGAGEVVDAGGGFLAPGYVDIHTHGGDGADFMDGTAEAVGTACRAHARHGTTTIFPTTTTGSPAQLEAMLSACDDAQRSRDGARIASVHLYGPFREAAARGCLVTCGHSNASWAEMARAFGAGMRHVDHFWCAMSSIPSVSERLGTPMQGSMAEFVLMHEEMSTEVIADGQHLAPELLEFAYRMIGPHRLCLVTDSSRALDMPPGEYRFGPQEDGELFESDGHVGFQADRLASSVTGMDRMVRNMAELTSASVADAVRLASLTPAERAGIVAEAGSLEPGKRADVLVLTPELAVERVFVGGVEA